VALTGSSGTVTANYTYAPYGTTSSTGTANASFQFSGRENDGASNLYYYRARYYSAQAGRFISQDPIGLLGGINLYAYVDGNPISLVDPLGESWQTAAGCFIKGAGVGALGSILIGAAAVGVVTLGAPVAAVTLGLGALAIIGGIGTGINVSQAVRTGNWDQVAYDVGGVAGGAAVGGAGGRAIAEGINGVPSPPWSWGSDISQGYQPQMGNLWQWLGTGPNPGSAGFSVAAAGAGAAARVGGSTGCGCN
jgi:RHS repeat-associated protein